MKKLETMLTERGQTSIPAQVRKEMRLKPGDRLRWQKISERECRLVVADEEPGPGAHAMLGYARRYRPTRPSTDWMRELREGEDDGVGG